jgi:lipopolysaccharide/colanic/teichoic acid biosynthesis glycosyltransferase
MATTAEKSVTLPLPASPRQRTSVARYCHWKGALDRVLALVLLVPGLPIMGVLVVITRLSSPGPGIFKQRRVGKNGRIFTMYKIRSMRSDAEVKTGAVWCVHNDPRITPLGYWLRKLHLDEFPQLVNVLRGEMSLVGPRPERPEFVEVLARQIPDYYDRLAVPPGITGLAQVNLPPDTDLDSVRRKLLLDQEYIANATLAFDLRMMLATFLRLFGLGGGRSLTLVRLHRSVELPTRAVDSPHEEENPFVRRLTCEEGGANGGDPTLRDTVAIGLGDTCELPAFGKPPASSASQDVETPQGDEGPQDDGFVSPDRIANRDRKTKPR